MIPLTTLLICLACSILIMTALWAYQKRSGFPAIVDVAWAFTTGGIGLTLCINAQGSPARRAVAAALILAWGLRLGFHLAKRFGRNPVDRRYVAMKERWGEKAERFMLGFFILQALAAVIFALPILSAATGETSSIPILTIGLVLSVGGMIGVTISDRQLAGFVHQQANKGKICRVGLWSWSRHPNYFFEWLTWTGFAVLASDGPLWYIGLGGMLLMLLLLLKVTGIPHVEREALRKRGDAWIEYQRETSVFIPLPPRKRTSE